VVWLLLIFAAWHVVAHSEGERHRVSQTTGTRSGRLKGFRRKNWIASRRRGRSPARRKKSLSLIGSAD